VIRSQLARLLRPHLQGSPRLKHALQEADFALARTKHALAARFPGVIRPEPRQLTVAITAACNLRCVGCRYGRDFMVGERLSLAIVRDLLDDARAAGVNRVRLFGGEPLLHPELAEMVRHATGLGLDTYVTTNGTLLAEKIDELFAAGLRWMSIGFYGVDEHYAAYTQREGQYEELVRGLEAVRAHHGDAVAIQLNYVLLRPTTTLEALRQAWEFAERFGLYFHLDLYGYSIPFFTDGPERVVAFRPEDRPEVEAVAAELVRLKQAHPERIPHAVEFLRSVPDWLLLGADMRVPCDAYQLLWVGANGDVQLCDVTFPLGNLHERRLSAMLFGEAHRSACRDAFQLKCPNCTCKVDARIRKHGPSLRRYGS
jgi:MoaA/NifB/PqqE/SkfB family radical SAM enzyme